MLCRATKRAHLLLLPAQGNKEPEQMLDFQLLPQIALFKVSLYRGQAQAFYPSPSSPFCVWFVSSIKLQGFSEKRNAMKWSPPRNEEHE